MTNKQIAGVILLEIMSLVGGWMICMCNMDEGEEAWHGAGMRMMQIGGGSLAAEAAIFCLFLATGVIS